jgi:CheY-like chemotaxis protein
VAEDMAPAEVRAASEPLRSIGRRLSILLIDDEEIVRTATAEMIRDLGHDVAEASGGAEGLALLDGGTKVDAVVTDYMMPGMDGGTLARRIAERHSDIPVLLITGYTGPSDEVLHLPRLAKPFGQSALAGALAGLFTADEKVVRLRLRKPRPNP